MKKEILKKLKSLNKRLTGDRSKGIGIALRLRSFYMGIKRSLRSAEQESLPERTLWEEEKRCQQIIAGYLTGKILVEEGAIKPEQLAEAQKRQRELQGGKERVWGSFW